MAAPTVQALQALVDALTARVAALEAQVATNATNIAALNQSDEASGWKQWRENKGKAG